MSICICPDIFLLITLLKTSSHIDSFSDFWDIVSEVVAQRCSVQKFFWNISSQSWVSKFEKRPQHTVFSIEFCEVFQDNFYKEQLWNTSSVPY